MANVLITGSSTGLGLATAIHLAKNGYSVYATLRNPSGAPDLQAAVASGLPIVPVALDVTSDQSVERGIAEVMSKAGRIDVLINNAGIGGGYVVEFTPIDVARQVFETNFFGAARMMRAVMPQMRERRSGVIVNVASIAGRFASACGGYYAASKFALEAISEAAHLEGKPYGVRVAVIEPGVVLTPIFGKQARETPPEGSPYFVHFRRLMKFFMTQLSNPTMPDAVAKTIQEAIESKAPKFRYPVGKDAAWLLELRAKLGDEGNLMGEFIEDDAAFYARMKSITGKDLWSEPANGPAK